MPTGGRARHPATVNARRWERLRRRVFQRDGWRCRSCGKAGRLEADHVIPLHRGGAWWEPGNVQALCRGCHIAKTGRERGWKPRPKSAAVTAWRRLVDALR